jgi:hypothetical protein
VSRCRSCDEEIVWALTEAGNRMPLDPDPVVDGNLYLEPVAYPGDDPYRVRAVRDGDIPAHRRVSHFATCPDADQHRKP